jgi:DNA-binding response OmpR family regulator
MLRHSTLPDQPLTGQEILLIEDDSDLVDLLKLELTKHHYRVRVARDGRRGLAEAQRLPPGLITLDLILPDMDGWELCRLLKEDPKTKGTPLLVLTALGQEEDRVRGLELGADDYLVKPFSLKELVARVRVLLRRSRMNTESKTGVQTQISVGSLAIDVERHEVWMAGKSLWFTPTEFAILKYLAQQPGRVFTRDQLITALWSEDRFVEEHNLDVHIHSLRQQLEPNPAHPLFLLTVRGVGYKLQIVEQENESHT